jgi:predicted transcriptional regulator
MTYRTGSIGEFMQWTMAVAKDPARAGDGPKRWRESGAASGSAVAAVSPEALVKLLSGDNLALLKLIGAGGFSSLRELAEQAKRKESNLSVTLKKLAEAGIVTIERHGKTLRPRLAASRVTLELDLVGAGSAVSVVQAA